MCAKKNQENLKLIENYLKYKIYPANIPDKGNRANFKRSCRLYKIKDDILYYKKAMTKVLFTVEERLKIIKFVHSGADSSLEESALFSHHGRDATQRLLKKRYFWPSMLNDVREYIKQCDACQKVNPASLKVIPTLHSVTVPKQVFKQIGVDIMSLPEVDNMKYVIVAIDYFSKWSEARALSDKSAETVARFLYDEIICRHGCPLIHITDQGREFLNKLISELFHLTGTKQRVTTAYHPQANGLVERQNRTIKNCLLKVLRDNNKKWPYILQGVLFAHRTAQHTSTFSLHFKFYIKENLFYLLTYVILNILSLTSIHLKIVQILKEKMKFLIKKLSRKLLRRC